MRSIVLICLLFLPFMAFAQSSEPAPDDDVYVVVESQPKPSYGMSDMYAYINRELRYPEEAKTMGIEGRVFVQFIVETTGELSSFEVLKSPHESLNKEAIRLLKLTSPWLPGVQRGHHVRVRMIMPVIFSLEEDEE